MIYQSTPDYYNDFIAHKDHKYIDKYRNASGRWVYVYTQPKLSDLPNPYVMLDEGMRSLRSKTSKAASNLKKKTVKGIAKGAGQAVRVNNQFNSYMNKKASAAGKKVGSGASKVYGSAAKKASSAYDTVVGKANEAATAYGKYAKKRKQVAAGKKLIKQHNVAKRKQARVESDNAVYRRALSNAYKTIKRRKSK